jgi:hypothetical protein
MKSSTIKLVLLAIMLLAVSIPQTAKSQTADSAQVRCQSLDSAHCGSDCPSPCRIISVLNLDHTLTITNVEVDCVDAGSNGMTACQAVDVTAVPNIIWALSSIHCSSSATASLPGSGLPYNHTLLIYECGCCKLKVTLTWSNSVKTVYLLQPDINFPFGCHCIQG